MPVSAAGAAAEAFKALELALLAAHGVVSSPAVGRGVCGKADCVAPAVLHDVHVPVVVCDDRDRDHSGLQCHSKVLDWGTND